MTPLQTPAPDEVGYINHKTKLDLWAIFAVSTCSEVISTEIGKVSVHSRARSAATQTDSGAGYAATERNCTYQIHIACTDYDLKCLSDSTFIIPITLNEIVYTKKWYTLNVARAVSAYCSWASTRQCSVGLCVHTVLHNSPTSCIQVSLWHYPNLKVFVVKWCSLHVYIHALNQWAKL